MTPLHITLQFPDFLLISTGLEFVGWILASLIHERGRHQGYKAGKAEAIEEIRGLARRSRGTT